MKKKTLRPESAEDECLKRYEAAYRLLAKIAMNIESQRGESQHSCGEENDAPIKREDEVKCEDSNDNIEQNIDIGRRSR